MTTNSILETLELGTSGTLLVPCVRVGAPLVLYGLGRTSVLATPEIGPLATRTSENMADGRIKAVGEGAGLPGRGNWKVLGGGWRRGWAQPS